MTNTWFTSDTHFGHANIIKYSKRPFADVDEMDNKIINNWNSIVQPEDTIWHLGDLCLAKDKKSPSNYLQRLNGKKHFIHGNHDRSNTKFAPEWASSQPYIEIEVEGISITLCHYGMRVWNKSHHGALHLYGHSHNSLPGDSQSLDVGVDCWDFKPVNLEQIQKRMKTLTARKVIDHHGRGD